MDPVCGANEVEDVAKRRAILLSVCGSKTHALARDLLQAAKPAETTFKKIVATLEKHFSPKPSEIVERYKFHSRNRNEDEGVAAYVAELRKLTEHCNFGETLPEMLRDRLVCGINNKRIQRRLLAERELTLKKAEEIASGEELAAKYVVDIQSDVTLGSVNQVDARDKNGIEDCRPDSECYHCGEKHEASACRFRDAQCFKCGRRGHLAKVCRGEKRQKKKTGKGTDSGTREGKHTGSRDSKPGKKKQPTFSGRRFRGRRCLCSDNVPHSRTTQTQGIRRDCGTLW